MHENEQIIHFISNDSTNKHHKIGQICLYITNVKIQEDHVSNCKYHEVSSRVV